MIIYSSHLRTHATRCERVRGVNACEFSMYCGANSRELMRIWCESGANLVRTWREPGANLVRIWRIWCESIHRRYIVSYFGRLGLARCSVAGEDCLTLRLSALGTPPKFPRSWLSALGAP